MSKRIHTEADYINPIAQHISELRTMKRTATQAGNTAVVALCDNQLDVITLLQDDHQRLEKAINHRLFKVNTPDIRAFIDNLD